MYHVDHTLTEAGERAARRATEAAYNGEPCVPFHQLVREEQQDAPVVRDNKELSDSELGGSEFSKPQVLEPSYNYDQVRQARGEPLQSAWAEEGRGRDHSDARA